MESLACILSRAELGLQAPLVAVEAHLGAGLPAFTLVGLPAPVVRESRERVRAALLSSGYDFPARRITINLAPVELAKHGGRFDLPIALALLVASGQLRPRGAPVECYGELGLAGELKPVGGLFLAALHAARCGHGVIVPSANAPEVALSGHRAAHAAATLRAAAALLCRAPPAADGREAFQIATGAGAAGTAGAAGAAQTAGAAGDPGETDAVPVPRAPALGDIVGLWQAKRALIVAAAGAHSLLLIGPPGSGKSMLAARLPGLLPPLSQSEAFEVAGVVSLSGLAPDPQRWREPPFRAPHHTASAQAIVGGGPRARPGEISLAHHGVLFLDELPEFDRRVLESLREPLESGSITISRAAMRLQLPARFQLVAAMNPCPCGYLGDPRRECRCTPALIERYRRRVSGPLLDRIDIRVQVPRLTAAELAEAAGVGTSAVPPAPAEGQPPAAHTAGPCGGGRDADDPAALVRAARERSLTRSGAPCAALSATELRRCCTLARPAAQLLHRSCQRLALSGRGVRRLLALSRTIADLEGSELIEPAHVAEAVQLRRPLGERG